MDRTRASGSWAAICAGLALAAAAGCGGSGGTAVDAGVDAEVVGSLTNQGSTEMEDVRTSEGGLANFMVDTVLKEGKRVTGEAIDLAMLEGGAIRGGRNSGPPDFSWSSETARIGNYYGPGSVTRTDVEGWYPFDNTMILMTLTGAQLKRSLEQGVSTWADDAGTTFGPDLLTADNAGPFLHVAGMTYEATCNGTTRIKVGPTGCDPSTGGCAYLNADQANTISKMTIGTSVVFDAGAGGWQGDGETHGFRVIMGSFTAAGLDNHVDFPHGTNRVPLTMEQLDFRQVMVARMRAESPVTLATEGRIVVKGTVHGLACNLPATCTAAHQATHPLCQH